MDQSSRRGNKSLIMTTTKRSRNHVGETADVKTLKGGPSKKASSFCCIHYSVDRPPRAKIHTSGCHLKRPRRGRPRSEREGRLHPEVPRRKVKDRPLRAPQATSQGHLMAPHPPHLPLKLRPVSLLPWRA